MWQYRTLVSSLSGQQGIRTIQEICHRLTVEKDAGNTLDIEKIAMVLKYHHIKTQPPDEQIVTQAMERMDKRISLDELKRKDLPKELFIIRNQTMYELVEKQGISQLALRGHLACRRSGLV